MALRNAGTTPAFESEEGDTTVAEKPAAPNAAAAAPNPATAVKVVAGGAIASFVKTNTVLDEMQGAIGIDMLETMGYNAFPRITVDQGGFSENKTKFLGNKIQFELVSWNFVTLIGCNEQNDKEADKLVRSSYDGVNLPNGGGTIDAYIASLKAQGYEKANTKKYVEMYGDLVWTEKSGDVAAEDRKLCQLSVSPQSVAQWGPHLLNARRKQSKAVEVTPLLTLEAERKTIGANTFGIINFAGKR